MILGIGVDLVEVARIEQAIERHGDAFLHRIFTADEFAWCSKMKSPSPHFAARFAAKEAVSKAFGTGIGAQLGWLDIEVLRDDTGKPSVVLHGSGAIFAESRGVQAIHLSLSHTATFAVAQVVVEGDDI